LLDEGDAEGLRDHLAAHPELVRRTVRFADGGYFTDPTLLEFAAENPVRRGTLPANVVEVATVVLAAGAKADRSRVGSALALVCSGRVPREHGVQVPLIDLLCDHGADPDRGMLPALVHGEFEAVDALLRRGARVDLPVAAALGNGEEVRRLLPASSPEARHRALALAAQHGRTDAVRRLLDAGEDPNRYNPAGCHAHSTPLHQAAGYGHLEVVQLLVERGAKRETKDLIYQGTPLDWARYGKHPEIERYLHEAG
jgi:hypothetical protein